MPSLALLVTPGGHLRLDPDPPGPAPVDATIAARLERAFASGVGPGLLHLGAAEVETSLPPVLAHFRELARGFVAQLCQQEDPLAGLAAGRPALDEATRARFLLGLPPMRGAEYADGAVLEGLWAELREAARARGADLLEHLRAASPVWGQVGRVHFHLAENKRDPERPFAFLATYATGVSSRAKVQHAPLGGALQRHAGARDREALLSLLAPVDRAASRCEWVKELVATGALYRPLAWTPAEAVQLLRDARTLEEAGLVVRVPELWKERRPPRVEARVTLGSAKGAGLGADALVDFDLAVTVDGERVSPQELRALLAGSDGLALLRGRWVEIDRAGLSAVLERWSEAERAHAEGLPFHEALRLLAGARVGEEAALLGEAEAPARVVAGPWLAEVLEGLRRPEGVAAADPSGAIGAELRPYQREGVRWLWWLRALAQGGCLADDMGLGKTIQVIALLALARRERAGGPGSPSLVVAPASLLGNWQAELARFAPQLRVLVAHASALGAAELAALDHDALIGADVVLTSYGTLQRVPALAAASWDVAIADEAQAIKNAHAKQSRAVRALRARCRLALTGTPVENRLGDLWSIFAFTNPGLLGTEREFAAFVKALEDESNRQGFAPLRALVRPYVLRRLKTQKEVIADLPDKTEVKAYCGLAKRQAALYQQTVEALARDLERSEGMARRGLVLASLSRLKQICNHPAHWLQEGDWDERESGKLQRLLQLAGEIAERQEKLLVFTQFKEATEPLAAHLARRFGRPGLVLSGETAVVKRQKMVEAFQAEEGPPFFVLSLRAGGTGLTLTAANHVVHFDRWWNPAVEDQATDRAFRIGQRRNVLVHKLVCRGTLEERIDELVENKRALAERVIEGGDGAALTELPNEEILRLVALDLRTAREEGP